MIHVLVEVEKNTRNVVENNTINLRTHINGFFLVLYKCNC